MPRNRAFHLYQRTASLTVFDGKSHRPVATVMVGTIPYAPAIDPSAHLLYAANFSSNDVTVVGK